MINTAPSHLTAGKNMKITKTWFKREIEITPEELDKFINLDLDIKSKTFQDITDIIFYLKERFK